MDDVIRDARDPPRKRHLPSADEKIRNGAQRAEAQPVQPRDGRPECAALASAKRQRSEHDDRPDVEIHQVPKPRAVERDLEQGKAERRIERLRPVHHRGQKQQQRDGMHVRDKAQALLARDHQRAEKRQLRDLADAESCGLTSRHSAQSRTHRRPRRAGCPRRARQTCRSRCSPPLLLTLVGGLAVHSQHIEAVLALCALDEVFLLERAAQVLFVGADGEGRVIAVQVVDVDGDLLTALLRLRLVCLPNDERGSRQHKHDDEGDDAFVVFLLHFAFSFSC